MNNAPRNNDRCLKPMAKWGMRNIACLCCLLFIQGALAQNQQPLTLLVDHNLKYHAVGLESVTESVVGFFDRQWSYQELPRNQVLQLRNIEDRSVEPLSASAQKAMLTLTDGQRFVGTMQLIENQENRKDPSVVHWYSPMLGPIAVPLDRVKTIAFIPSLRSQTSQKDDRVRLVNGDELSGFLLKINHQALELELANQTAATKIDLDQVTFIELANPRVENTSPMQHIYFVDGTILHCQEVLLNRQMLFVTGTHWQSHHKIPMREIVRIDLASRKHHITSLTHEPYEILSGAQAFGVNLPPHLSDDAIQLHAPLSIRFNLPKGATRFTANAQINWQDTDPPRARSWTDFVLKIFIDDKLTYDQQFNSQFQQQRLNLLIPNHSKHITLKLFAGLNGPVMDRLRLMEPVVLIENK
ncbi:MAG: hypothetical protein JKX85_03570 [Phycisphaeraceae bacterium]|nr:hypothetical protein [Phycisphaeraceae bacterium]